MCDWTPGTWYIEVKVKTPDGKELEFQPHNCPPLEAGEMVVLATRVCSGVADQDDRGDRGD